MMWRLIIDKARNAADNMAIDAALLQHTKEPTLRLYTWQPPAVSIGRFQSLKDEVDLDFCKGHTIDVIRRITGGGAVFHEHEVTYSVVIPEKNDFFSSDLHESYRQICQCIINGLTRFGIEVSYVPLNDLIVNGKKISGCAQTRKHGKILQHGTILLDVDVERMFHALKVPEEKIRDKLIKMVEERVTSLQKELGKKVTEKQVMDNIVEGFKESGITFEESELTEIETKSLKKIQEEIFNEEFLHER